MDNPVRDPLETHFNNTTKPGETHALNSKVSNGLRDPYHFYYVYLLQSLKSGKFYTGYTSDLRKRFKEHQNNQSRYTKGRGPFQLIYYESCLNEYDARARETYLKSGPGKRYLKNRLKRFLSLTGYNENSAVRFSN